MKYRKLIFITGMLLTNIDDVLAGGFDLTTVGFFNCIGKA